jgi:uncharacterized protein YuzE
MNTPKLRSFQDEDIIQINMSDGDEVNSVELLANMTAELDQKGAIMGIEILSANTFLRDTLLNTVQAKLLTDKQIGSLS